MSASMVATAISNCPICDLPAPAPPTTPTSCSTLAGSGSAYLLLVGDPGLPPHDTGRGFALAAQQNANELKTQGHKVTACRISSVQDFNKALTGVGFIDGGVIYYGHSGPYDFTFGNTTYTISILAPGQGQGIDTNIGYYNITKTCDTSQGCNINQYLGSNVEIVVNGCRAAVKVTGLTDGTDLLGITTTPIAKLLARQLNRNVRGYKVGTYLSLKDAAHATSKNRTGEPNPLPGTLPMYLIPEGAPGHKKAPEVFTP